MIAWHGRGGTGTLALSRLRCRVELDSHRQAAATLPRSFLSAGSSCLSVAALHERCLSETQAM